MKRLMLVRHARSVYNERQSKIIGGRSNHIPLSETGLKQPQMLAKFIRFMEYDIGSWYTSPAVRAHKTGELTLNNLGIDLIPIFDDRLQEMSQGEYGGKPRDIYQRPDIVHALQTQQKDFKLSGGESVNEVAQRFDDAVKDITIKLPNEQTALVTTHGMSIGSFIGANLGWSRDKIIETKRENCSVTSLIQLEPGDTDFEYIAHDTLVYPTSKPG